MAIQQHDLIQVVVAVIRRQGGPHASVLVARRDSDAHQGGLLELPGGKVEAGESPRQALCRELYEELGLKADPGILEPLIQVQHNYGDRRIRLDAWTLTAQDASQLHTRGKEGQPLFWLSPRELLDRDFPAANRPLLRAIRLPQQLLITGSAPAGCYPRVLSHSLSHVGEGLCVYRAPDLSEADYRAQIPHLLEACQDAGTPLMLHGSPERFHAFPQAAGLHLPWHEARHLRARPLAADRWLGVSCHNGEELAQAEVIGADYATLSPVKSTASHPEQASLGWAAFADTLRQAKLPVYALGGMRAEDRPVAIRHGAQGVAGIGFWWAP